MPLHHALGAQFKIKGLTPILEKNLESHLTPLTKLSVSNITSNRLTQMVNNALNPYGYYHSELRAQSSEFRDQRIISSRLRLTRGRLCWSKNLILLCRERPVTIKISSN
ncbi:POTRA domain-containing protein [Vibrio parahaemolyticus]|nr:POTRA domain-containing protein [Vibrio parahaemolyticus]